jgi:hypothetical protein
MPDIFRSLSLQYLHSLPSARQLEFVYLPAEILAETFACLDFPGVLTVKLVRYNLPYPCH